MTILLSKLALAMIYPVGIFCVLVLLAVFRRFSGKSGRGRILLGLAVIVLLVSASPQFAKWAASTLEDQYAPVAIDALPVTDTMVVLGGVLSPPVSPRLQIELVGTSDRLLHAARIYRSGKAKRVFLSGGNVFNGFDHQPESHYGKSLLEEWGVPGKSIFIDDRSRTTYENAIQSRNFLSEKGWINKQVLLVTSALHMPRAVETFSSASIRVIPVVTDILVTDPVSPGVFQWLPSAGALQLTTLTWHEWIGLWFYRLRGWALPN